MSLQDDFWDLEAALKKSNIKHKQANLERLNSIWDILCKLEAEHIELEEIARAASNLIRCTTNRMRK